VDPGRHLNAAEIHCDRQNRRPGSAGLEQHSTALKLHERGVQAVTVPGVGEAERSAAPNPDLIARS
jgi:hypothetical protein